MKFSESVIWIDPHLCNPPHGVTHPEKFVDLCDKFIQDGWDINEPALLGYSMDKIQLISGSHRWAAAVEASIKIPVILYNYDEIYDIWGSDEWLFLLDSVNHIEYKK